MKRWQIIGTATLAMIVLVAFSTLSQEPAPMEAFMRSKLAHAQKVLEGVTTEDFDLVRESANELSRLSQAASWQVMQTPDYTRQSVEFRRIADELAEAAVAKNLDGAALKYVELTMKCVNCHKYVRHIRIAQVDVRDAALLAHIPSSLNN